VVAAGTSAWKVSNHTSAHPIFWIESNLKEEMLLDINTKKLKLFKNVEFIYLS
jgi:hypothetical protein